MTLKGNIILPLLDIGNDYDNYEIWKSHKCRKLHDQTKQNKKKMIGTIMLT